MKLRSAVVVMSAAVIGAAPMLAQAAHRDGQGRGSAQYSNADHRGQSGHYRGDSGRSNSNGLAIALGIGLIGLAAIASQRDDPEPYTYAPAYPQPGYGYNPAPYDGSQYGHRGYARYGHDPYAPQPINPMTGY